MGDHALPSPSELPAEEAPEGPAGINFNLVIAVGASSFFSGVGATLMIFAVTRGEPAPALSAAPSSDPAPLSVAAPPIIAPSASASAPPVRVGKSDAASPEAQARSALTRLRDGIGTCVRDVIGVLPGTSPAVPLTMRLMKNGVYASLSSDFRSPVFACASYRETEPQSFQIQWQRGATPGEGTGVAWVDDNGDGAADRAFGFRATLVKKKEVTFGEITPLEPVPKVLTMR